jgi:hypothetical protein
MTNSQSQRRNLIDPSAEGCIDVFVKLAESFWYSGPKTFFGPGNHWSTAAQIQYGGIWGWSQEVGNTWRHKRMVYNNKYNTLSIIMSALKSGNKCISKYIWMCGFNLQFTDQNAMNHGDTICVFIFGRFFPNMYNYKYGFIRMMSTEKDLWPV